MNHLWVVMPVYNEEECIAPVIQEWLTEFRLLQLPFTFCIINDGSVDNTTNIIHRLASKEKELLIIDKKNSGHGQSCIEGYRLGITNNADWIFQIDSDGQCDPKFFKDLLTLSANYPVIYGFRKTREDGYKRYIISRILSVFAFFATGAWVHDANVPYRLMQRATLEDVVKKIPPDFYLANVLVAILQKKQFGIRWVDIHFRSRLGSEKTKKTFLFARQGIKLFRDLRSIIPLAIIT